MLVPGILSGETIKKLRNRITQIFETGEWKKSPFNTHNGLAGVYDEFPELIADILNPQIIELLRDLLGTTPVLMPESAIHYRFYTGWHKDTTSQERAGHDFHYTVPGMLLQCGYYLQDNDELGGGLTVMPGSHLTSDPFLEPGKPASFGRKVSRKLGLYSEQKDKTINPHGHRITDIPSKAGDFVIFNMKTNHRATQPRSGRVADVPKEKEKIAMFNAFTSHDGIEQPYFDFIINRPEPFYQHSKTTERNQQLTEHAKNLNFIVR